jgi:short-subunit dehydrogenase
LALAGEGANLVITARRQERLAELKAAIQKEGGQAISLMADAKERRPRRQTVDLAIQTFGSLDILINNVGIGNYKN